MRFLKIIIVAIASIFFSACVDLDIQAPNLNNTDEITLVGRMTRFDDYNVATRAAKQGDESKISSYAMAIFSVENNAASKCVFYEYHSSGNQLLFTIDRSNQRYVVGQEYAIYVFANMPGMEEFKDSYASTSLETMLAKRYEQTGITLPEDNGFPMIGSLGDYFSSEIDNDGKHFIMSPTAGEEPPTVDGTATTTLSVPMKALYAKMNFHIEVRPDQMIEGSSFPPQFELASYKLVNVPASVDFSKSTNADSDVSEGTEGFENNVGVLSDITVDMGNVVASGARVIEFSFYLPENLLVPQTDTLSYPYPFKGTFDASIDTDRDGIRNEDEKYCQRYKGKLLGANQPATCIVLSGNFRDHQNHTVKVDYTIHLGKDNFSDFNIVRNSEYNNDITIKGILNSNDNADHYISLDHRVNVEHKEPNIITLRREVLLDSHFEIRPLRIKYNKDFEFDDKVKAIRVEVVNPTTTNWMRIERSFGDGNSANDPSVDGKSIYISDADVTAAKNEGRDITSSKGKRRYFTYDLVSGGNQAAANYSLVNSTSVTIPIPTSSNENQCIWIYVDECIDTGDAVRSGIIRVTYLDSDGDPILDDEEYPVIDYTINQRKLFRVHYQDTVNTNIYRPYDIEYHEEYLHNFDSDETFGQTHYEGMKWGAENVEFSHQFPAVYVDPSGGLLGFLDEIGWKQDEMMNSLIESATPYYDFYLTRDKIALNLPVDTTPYDNKTTGVVVRDYSGHIFSSELISKLNNENKISDGTLASVPKSAVEYCYHKNKRDIHGNVVNSQWYLPAVDEIEEIVTSKYKESENSQRPTLNTYARFIDFQAKFYWSSQPAYIQSNVLLRFYIWLPFVDKSSLGSATGDIFEDNIGDSEYGDPGSARSTSVSYVNGKYKAVTSGLSGAAYDLYYEYYNGLKEPVYTLISPSPTPDAGYKPRTDMARVRCVRKQPIN